MYSFNKMLTSDEHEIRLTLDVRLQHILRREVQKAITDFTAKAGAGVVMDAHTGEVLAAVSLPDFNPQAPSAKANSETMSRINYPTRN